MPLNPTKMFLSVKNFRNLIKNMVWNWPFLAQTPLPRSHLFDSILPPAPPWFSFPAVAYEPFGDGESPLLSQACAHLVAPALLK